MVSLSLVSGLSDSPNGFPPAVPGVFSGSLPAPLGLGGELNSLIELLSLCCEEPTSPREVLDSLGFLSLVLPLGGWGEGVLVWRGRSLSMPFGDSLALVVPLWQLHGGGSLALAVPLRQVLFGGLLASAVPPGWFVGGRSFLPGVFPPRLGVCLAPLVCNLLVLLALPGLPRRWVVEAFRDVGPHVRLGFGPSCYEGVVWSCPDASGICVGAWFLACGCHPGYVGGVRVVREGLVRSGVLTW